MILFISTFLTNEFRINYDRGILPHYDRVDVFKYSLASLSVIDWSHVIIYYDLDTNFKNRREEIDQYIKSLFHNPTIYPFRNDSQPKWKEAMEKVFAIEDDWIWFCCNHDHVFIDYELDLLKQLVIKLTDLSKSYEYVSCYFSHWPEMLIHNCLPARDIDEGKDWLLIMWHNPDSLQIVNKNILRYWWFEYDYGNTWIPRPDGRGLNTKDVVTPEIACIIPYRELVRHFDGYSHAEVSINVCPPLFIPEGFFDNDIKILYCSDTRKKGYVSINPLKENYTTIDSEGADMKCMLEDIPLFWRSRISKIEIAKDVDRNVLIKHRNDAVLKMANAKIYVPTTRLGIALR